MVLLIDVFLSSQEEQGGQSSLGQVWIKEDSYLLADLTLTLNQLVRIAPQECAEFMLRPLFDLSMSTGAHHLWEHAEPLDRQKLYLDIPGQRESVWNHLVETLGAPLRSTDISGAQT